MEKNDISLLSYRNHQIDGLLTALKQEIEPLINKLPQDGETLTNEVAIKITLDLNAKSDAIMALLYAIGDFNEANAPTLDVFDAHTKEIEQLISKEE